MLPRGGAATRAGELRRELPGGFDLAYGFAAREALPLLLEAGYRKLGEVRRFALALRPSSFVRATARRAEFGYALNPERELKDWEYP